MSRLARIAPKILKMRWICLSREHRGPLRGMSERAARGRASGSHPEERWPMAASAHALRRGADSGSASFPDEFTPSILVAMQPIPSCRRWERLYQ